MVSFSKLKKLNDKIPKKVLGKHYILELRVGDSSILDDGKRVLEILKQAAKQGNLNVLDVVERKFSPQGFTAVLLLSESHISIHTWPEYKYAAIDVFTCGGSAERALEAILDGFKAEGFDLVMIERGFLDED